ncbi:uncharacterized protein LOC130430640 [Triplophysa dalaica]|uniref:uncharacterized protein LOC130430640 n=1 Tax=Triplophysa dalaica TaxID=1582913 RepID=UPI0024DFE4C6|nr:uncharacterized protein LOC130430640 [Triplophysa dalaica]
MSMYFFMQLLKKMFAETVYFCLCVVVSNGVFGVDADEVKSVSVMEGDSVTLHTDLTHIQRYDKIEWIDESQRALMAQIFTQAISICDGYDERFKVKLKLENQTGSLTITNISIIQSGLYKLKICNNKTSYRRFNVTVYARLPVPFITSDFLNCSSAEQSSNCSFLCSVTNVTHVSLSWYKGNSLLSSMSVSDLNIRLSLPLEVESQDTNTYRCVVNNPITNQTQHLTNVCKCSEHQIATIVAAVVVTTLCLLGIIGVIHHRKRLLGYNLTIQKKLPTQAIIVNWR